MKYVNIPKTEIKVSQIALGTWPLSGDVWGPMDEGNSIRTIEAALDSGINFIDTAPIYGFGRAEEIVGKAVKGKRDRVVIATKCGLEKVGKAISINLKSAFIRSEIEASLKRLNINTVDLYQIHWPDPKNPLEESMREIKELVKEGKVRAVGVCNADLDYVRKASVFCPISTVQNQFSLLKREDEKELLPALAKEGIGFLAYAPLAGGILSGKYKSEPHFKMNDARGFFYPYYKGEGFEKASRIVGDLIKLAEKNSASPAQIALSWTIQQPAVVAALVGAKSPTQVRMNAASADLQISGLNAHSFPIQNS